jgi:hypothetical protein
MKIIGIGYKKNRGKDTVAKFMTDLLYPKKVKVVGFADKLKDIAFQLFGWAGLERGIYYESHYADKEVPLPLLGLSPRDIWIALGNKCREIYQPIWIDNVIRSNHKCDVLIIKDTGFTNEATAIRQAGGTLIKVTRPGQETALDARETELDTWTDWDCVFDNDSGLVELQQKVADYVRLS